MKCKTCGFDILPEDTYCKNGGRTLTGDNNKLNLEENDEQYIIDIRKQPALFLTRKSLYRVFDNNPLLSFFMSFSPLLILLYPFYLLCGEIDGLYSIFSFFYSFSAVLETAFILGIILCFILGQKLLLTVSFGLLALHTVLTLTQNGAANFNSIFNLFIFVVLALSSYKSTAFDDKLHSNTPITSISPKIVITVLLVVLILISIIVILNGVKTCDICGELITEGYEYNDTVYCKECFWTN